MEPVDLATLADDVRRGPLFERQLALGATFVEDYGRLWTASFGDPESEYRAAREGAAIWDVSALSKWHVTGPDALAAMDRLTTRPTAADRPGQVRYVMLLNDDGLLVEEATRYILGPNEVWLIGNEDRPAMAAHIEGVISQLDVRVENRTDEVVSIAVQGPRSAEVLSPLVDRDVSSLGYYHVIDHASVAHADAMVSRTGFSGELGYELFVFGGADAAGEVWDAVIARGATPMGLDAVEMLRVESGFVVADEDYVTGETDPADLSLERFIDLDSRTPFVGREAFVRRLASPTRRFVTLSIEGDETMTHDPVVVVDGAEVGEVRSVQHTPRFGMLALAVIDEAQAVDGTRVLIGSQRRPATVRPRPIDDGDRARRARP